MTRFWIWFAVSLCISSLSVSTPSSALLTSTTPISLLIPTTTMILLVSTTTTSPIPTQLNRYSFYFNFLPLLFLFIHSHANAISNFTYAAFGSELCRRLSRLDNCLLLDFVQLECVFLRLMNFELQSRDTLGCISIIENWSLELGIS